MMKGVDDYCDDDEDDEEQTLYYVPVSFNLVMLLSTIQYNKIQNKKTS